MDELDDVVHAAEVMTDILLNVLVDVEVCVLHNRTYRHREPKHVFGDPFVGVVLDALHAKQITLTKASTYLDNLKISDLHQLEAFYAGV